MREILLQSLNEAHDLLGQFIAGGGADEVHHATELLTSTFQAGGKVLSCGNGGSMADAMHFAEEWTGRFRKDRKPYPAMALCDPTHLTCVSNDFGFDKVFSRMVEAFGQANDLLLVLSTSGESPNLIEATKAAKVKNMKVLALLGKGGGQILPLVDLAIVVPGKTSDRIQELHMLILHAMIEATEAELED